MEGQRKAKSHLLNNFYEQLTFTENILEGQSGGIRKEEGRKKVQNVISQMEKFY